MARKSRRRGSRGSRRRVIISVAIIAIFLVSAIGIYAYSVQPKVQSSGTSTTTSINCSSVESSTPSAPSVTPVSPTAPLYAVINTTQGSMVVQLFPSVAPKTVANFVALADSGFYDHLVWHRIVQGFVIQTGDPTSRYGCGDPSNWGGSSSSLTEPLEANSTTVADGYVNNVGYLGIARGSSTNSGSSQFFINLANNTSLNGQYTVFGKVITGLSVATTIGSLPVASTCASSGQTECPPTDPTNAEILSITIQSTP